MTQPTAGGSPSKAVDTGTDPLTSDNRSGYLRSLPTAVWVLAAGQFVNAFGNFLPIFLVLYLTARGVAPSQAGLALSCYGAARIAAPLLAGRLADRVARRVVIALGMGLSGGSVAAVLAADHVHAVMALAAGAGAGAALAGPAAAALVADLVPVGARVQGFAVQRLAVNLGYATGPAAAGILVAHGYRWLFVVQPVTCAVFAMLSLTALPSTPVGVQPCETLATTKRPGALRSLSQPRPVRLMLALACAHIVYFQTLVTLPLVVRASGQSPATYGLLSSLNGLLVIGLELPFAACTRRTRRRPTIAVGFLLIGAGISSLGLIQAGPAVPLLVLCVILYSLGEMVFDPVAQTYTTELAPREHRARYQVAFATCVNAGYFLAPVLGGFLYTDDRVLLWPVLLGLAVAAAALVVWPENRRPRATPLAGRTVVDSAHG